MAVDDTKQRVDSSSGVPSRAAEALTAAWAESHQPAAASFGSRIQRCPVPSEKPSSAGTPSPWSRQPNETSRQFAVFCAYRDMHPLERSLVEVGRKLGVTKTYVERLSARRDWVKRAGAFDDERDRLAHSQRARRIEEMNVRHARIASTALRKVEERLEMLDADSMRPADVARLMEIAARQERVARGGLPHESISSDPPVLRAEEIRAALKAEGLL